MMKPIWETGTIYNEACFFLKGVQTKLLYEPVAMDDGRYITLRGINHPEYLAKWTVMVSYESLSSERIQAPFDASAHLPKWTRKRKAGEDCQIVLYGDSISYGCDCSGLYHLPPDLVILGFGMNDRCSAAEYADRTKRLVQCVQQQYPEAEVLLIVTTLPNARVSTLPIYFCAQQHTFPDVLFNVKKDGIGIADVQGVQTQIMQQKSYLDLTANYLNHPNDYLARIQAQTVVQALGAWHKA